jgi:DNA-binding MarR family transcriptional regulator
MDVDERDQATERLERARKQHVGRLLLRAHRDFSSRAIAKLRERGYRELTLSHLSLLPHLDATGTRTTVLAERGGMTKQGMGQLVIDLERQGYLLRSPDPTDGRAVLVTFSAQGEQLLWDALAVTGEVESEYAAALGQDRMNQFREMLAALTAIDEEPEPG